MSGATWLQHRIEAQQLLEDIDYALRSIRECGSANYVGKGVHFYQLERGCEAAALFLDSTATAVRYAGGGHGCKARLLEAKKIAAETLKETKAIIREQFGTARQLRLAIAAEGAHEMALAA